MSGGIIRAMGYQKIATYAGIFAYWVVGVPLIYIFGFTLGMGEKGIWWSQPILVVLICSLLLYIAFSVDMIELSGKISDRIAQEKQKYEKEEKLVDEGDKKEEK